MVTYVEAGIYTVERKELNRPYGMGVDGYGAKIATNHVLRFNGENRRYRVYATCFGNTASQWIMRKGVKLHVR
jgi:hypothetical protein